jgi:hypothetical protein
MGVHEMGLTDAARHSRKRAPAARLATTKPAEGPAGYRLWLVYAVLAVIVGGSFFDIITGREHWPFSPYPMYATVPQDRALTQMRLYGVTEDTPPREMPLVAFERIQPFSPSNLQNSLARISAHREPVRRVLLEKALRDCLDRYESLRRAGRHSGPPLRGVRLCRVHWKLDPWARNVDRPDRRELVYAVMRR